MHSLAAGEGRRGQRLPRSFRHGFENAVDAGDPEEASGAWMVGGGPRRGERQGVGAQLTALCQHVQDKELKLKATHNSSLPGTDFQGRRGHIHCM